ncbi:MAG: secretion protein [Myxococcales bacterium]|nr:secretion protein [Myxococcales bacterium]
MRPGAWCSWMLGLVAGCEAAVATGLSETEADEIVVALDRVGIAASKERTGTGDEARFEVRTAQADVPGALVALRAVSLPRVRETSLTELFGGGGLVPTPVEERARLAAALGGELARSLESVDGVLDARVHVALPEPQPLRAPGQEPPRPRASVLVRHRADARPPDEASVRALVAGAVDGLRPEDVSVVAVAAAVRAPAPEAGLVRMGPVAVSRGSLPAFRALAAAALGTNLLLAGALVFVLVRRRRSRSAGAPSTPTPAAPS